MTDEDDEGGGGLREGWGGVGWGGMGWGGGRSNGILQNTRRKVRGEGSVRLATLI